MLPGHRATSHRCLERIPELRRYHESRVAETFETLGKIHGADTAYGIASRMKWGRSGDSWKRYPALQRWFAAGEVIANLENLRLGGFVKRRNSEGVFLYTI
jgi:hypothetical protein